MSFVTPRLVRSLIEVPLGLLAIAFRCETEVLCPRLRDLQGEAQTLQTDLKSIVMDLESLLDGIRRCQADVDALRETLLTAVEENYRLCGRLCCDGSCRVCQEEDYLGEEEYTEKYCRRGRR